MSLRKNDLKYMMYDIFEVDNYGSKMGADSDVVTVNFSLKEKDPAKDLVHFLEAGYDFILDADVSPGEMPDGTYKVFVEFERNRHVADNINEMLDGVRKISGVNNLKFRYHKNFKSREATMENLSTIPTDAESYEMARSQVTMENFKHFFANSYSEVEMLGETIIIKKPHHDTLYLHLVEMGDSDKVTINEKFNLEDYSEVLYITKYLSGCCTVNKYGENIVLDNNNKTLITKRL